MPTPAAKLADSGQDSARAARSSTDGAADLATVVEFLPTPQAHDAKGGKTPEQVDAMRARTGAGVANLVEVAEAELLPSPTVAIADGGQVTRGGDRAGEALLGGVAAEMQPDDLLPTPSAALALGGQVTADGATTRADGSKRQVSLSDAVRHGVDELLPTPSTSNRDGNQQNNRGELLLPGVAEKLLPTPVVTDSEEARNATAGRSPGAKPANAGETLLDAMTTLGLADPGRLLPTPVPDPLAGNGHARDLGGEVSLLPTPAVSQNDGEGFDTWEARRQRILESGINGNGAGMPLPIAVQLLDSGQVDATADGEPVRWSKYRAAILRAQAVAGRVAPSPTVADGKGGKRRLAARFVEWMMLLPVGWVTDVPGLTRRDMLKLLGNGVVPAQAAAASVLLLARLQARLGESAPDRGRP